MQAHMVPGLAGLGYLATLIHRQAGHEVAQHWAWHDNPAKKGEWCPLLAGHSDPNPRQGSAWSLFARISFPPGAVLQCSSHSPHNLQCILTASTVTFGKPRGRFLTGARQHSFTVGLGAIPVHPKRGSGTERQRHTAASPWVWRLGILASQSNSTAEIAGNHTWQ